MLLSSTGHDIALNSAPLKWTHLNRQQLQVISMVIDIDID